MTRDENRAAGLDLLRLGLVTLSEVAECAGVSRQAVHKWTRVAGLDWKGKRADLVRKLWQRRAQA